MSDFAVASSATFSSLAGKILRIPQTPGTVMSFRRFRSLFGITDYVCSLVWNTIASRVPRGGDRKHLLWGLMFLKVYANEHVHSRMVNVDEKPFRKWAWVFVRLVSGLKIVRKLSTVVLSQTFKYLTPDVKIKWETRVPLTTQSITSVSVDATDCSIQEPAPFDTKWFSHKFKAAGVRYEIGICIKTGRLVWIHGAFPCGTYPDVRIFRLGMKNVLERGEKVIADGGYPVECCITPTEGSLSDRRMMSVIRARHETVNRRLKHFAVLSNRFRHHLSLHSICFHAVAHLTQLMIQHEQPLFNV